MSLSLKLLVYGPQGSNYAHTIIECTESRGQYEKFYKLMQLDVEPGFSSYFHYDDMNEVTHYGEVLEDPFGDPLKFTYAKHLREVITDKAPKAYLEALDDNHKIALYWQ